MERERRPLLRRSAEPNIRLGTRAKVACFCVLATETLERIAFYGLVGNLVLFLNTEPFNWYSFNAVNTMFIFTGVSYISSIISGWFADAYLGKFRSVVLFLVIYLLGYAMFPVMAFKRHSWCNPSASHHNVSSLRDSSTNDTPTTPSPELRNEICFPFVFLALLVVAIGNGGVKSSIAPFGADQVKKMGANMTRTFFNWFYWCINIGAFLSLGVLAYVQQNINFQWGYVAPSVCLALALVIFVIGTASYVRKPAAGSVLSNVFRVLCEACRNRPSSRLSFSSQSTVDTADFSGSGRGWLDAAKVRYGGSFHDNLVDDVRSLGKILLVFLAMVPYWTVYFQMETTYPVQGLHMRLNNSKEEFKIPTAWLSLFDVIFLLFMLPFVDRVLYPWFDRRGRPLSLPLRIVIGMCFAAASVGVAGGVEIVRLRMVNQTHTFNQTIDGTIYHAADMSVLWQIPQYALIGISEAFASVAGLELAYTFAPRSMVTLVMGLFWFSQGLASFLGTALVASLHAVGLFFGNGDYGDINCPHCHVDHYFFLLCGLQVVGIILFIIVTRWLRIGTRPHHSNGVYESVSTPNRNSRSNTRGYDSPQTRGYGSSNGNTSPSDVNRRSPHIQRVLPGDSEGSSSNGS